MEETPTDIINQNIEILINRTPEKATPVQSKETSKRQNNHYKKVLLKYKFNSLTTKITLQKVYHHTK